MDVARDVAAQLKAGEENIMGVMVESHLVEGRQDKPEVYGQSITDACIGWDTTEELLACLPKRKVTKRKCETIKKTDMFRSFLCLSF